MNDEPGLTLDEAAERAGVHYQTVYRWVRAGKLPATKINGSYLVRPDSLADFLRARETPTVPPRPARVRLDRQSHAMSVALVAGDETKVRSIARLLLGDGTPVTILIEQLLVPPLREIGARWHDGELPIFVEHRASAIVERLLGELMPNPPGRRRGRALVAALSGDRHTLPTTMATAALKEDHWHVEHLGADVPIDELEAFVAAHHIDVAVISNAIPRRTLAKQAKRRLEEVGVPTIVGTPGATLTELQMMVRSALHRVDES